MLNLIKELWNPKELIDADGERVVFKAARKLKPGSAVPLSNGNSQKFVVCVESLRPLPEGGYACVARPLQQAPVTEASETPAGFRSAPRTLCSLRVQSQGLPGFMGLVLDLSATGARLQTSGPIEVGSELWLRVDVDGPEPFWMDLMARVAWCAERGRSHFEAGFSFIEVNEHQRQQLDWLTRHLQAQQNASVFHRSLGYTLA